MAELITLARPYAKAAFEVALADNELGEWSRMLRLLAQISEQEEVNRLLLSPRLTAEKQAETLIDICGDELSEKARNLVRLLADNKRLGLLPEIVELFDALKAEQEQTIDVELTTAFELNDEVVEKLAQALRQRLQREVRLQMTVEKSLIGGAVIRAGDTVIDNSVRGKLTKLAEAMNS